jgi:hypothetical protein
MRSMASTSNREFLPLAALFLFELAAVVIAKALHMKGERPFGLFLLSNPGIALCIAAALALLCAWFVIRTFLIDRRSSPRRFHLLLGMNLVTVMLLILAGEITLRFSTRHEGGYDKIGSLTMKPYSWESVRSHYRHRRDEASVQHTSGLYEEDELIGSKLRPNAQGIDQLYWTSAEGLRASGEGFSFKENPARTDIAVIGDSFTFGYEVRYGETYGFALEQILDSRYRVLNFGVPGHGLGQIFLRYQRDIRPWKPKIVILGFISSDTERAMWVYPFLGSLTWPGAYSKPRVTLHEDEFLLLNAPAIPPDAVLSKASVFELPFLEYQRGFSPSDWEERFYHASYLVRLFITWRSAGEEPRPETSDETLVNMNARLLRKFVDSAKEEGSIPLVVFFPSKHELQRSQSTPPIGIQVAQAAGVAYLDSTPCFSGIPLSDLYMPGNHYTPQGNAALAKCVAAAVNKALTSPDSRNN